MPPPVFPSVGWPRAAVGVPPSLPAPLGPHQPSSAPPPSSTQHRRPRRPCFPSPASALPREVILPLLLVLHRLHAPSASAPPSCELPCWPLLITPRRPNLPCIATSPAAVESTSPLPDSDQSFWQAHLLLLALIFSIPLAINIPAELYFGILQPPPPSIIAGNLCPSSIRHHSVSPTTTTSYSTPP